MGREGKQELETAAVSKQIRAGNDRILIDPAIQHGKPVIRGTRVPVARILGGLASGMTVEKICREYDVSAEDVRAAVRLPPDLCETES